MAPRELTPPLHSLPPILDNTPQTPMSSCSKGSRGLSVQPRVLGIFTETTISPDPSLRQRPSRYAIRAGRNFAFTLHFWRRRLSLHLGVLRRVRSLRADLHSVCGTRDSVTKGRRLISLVDLPPGGGRERDVTSRRTISRYGVNLLRGDFPRDHPFATTTSLKRRIRGGLPRY